MSMALVDRFLPLSHCEPWTTWTSPPTIEFRSETEDVSYEIYSLKDRIDELRGYCEEEGFSIDATSEIDFWEFVGSVPFYYSMKFDVVATERGNLRASWDDGDKHIGIQFLGDEQCEYVVWASTVRPDAARDKLGTVMRCFMDSWIVA